MGVNLNQGGVLPSRSTLNLSIVSGAALAAEALQLALKDFALPVPTTLILDSPPGFAFSAWPAGEHPVLIVTPSCSPHYLHDLLALHPAPAGVMHEPVTLSQLQAALKVVARGQAFHQIPPLPHNDLSPREREVLRWVALGLENEAVADRLGIKVKSVADMLSRVKWKLGLQTRVDLARYYLGLHLVTL
ncbi:LuxR family transcriptional regulator [Calidithermus roseus]|nr:LuxR C-terminal-related transcriptional regulator [Calidithermus roseus]